AKTPMESSSAAHSNFIAGVHHIKTVCMPAWPSYRHVIVASTHMRAGTCLAVLGVLGILWAQGSGNEETFVGARGRYWAFQKVVRPAVPAVQDAPAPWTASNPIDAFILERLEQKQLKPSQPLDRTRL